MSDRKIAILIFDESRLPEVRNTVQVLMASSACSEITVFSERDIPDFNVMHEQTRCASEKFPLCEKPGSQAARRNAVLRKYEAEGFAGILHVISDDVSLLRDPSEFMRDLDSMMRELDYPLWLSTVTDPCNYVYGRYNPRLMLMNDMPELHQAGIKYSLAVTSHSNTAWMAYDLAALSGQREIEYFSEQFEIPMFYIVELLARRREHKRQGQLFYMNQYLTVASEYGVFKLAQGLPPGNPATQQTMQAEDEKFKAMHVRYEPDYSMDMVIDAITEKIIAKTGKNGPQNS